jgi:hypothetical protein
VAGGVLASAAAAVTMVDITGRPELKAVAAGRLHAVLDRLGD